MPIQVEPFIFLSAIFDQTEAALGGAKIRKNPIFTQLLDELGQVGESELADWWVKNKSLFELSLSERRDAYDSAVDPSTPTKDQLPALAEKVREYMNPETPGDLVFLRTDFGFSLEKFRDIAGTIVQADGDKLFTLMHLWKYAAYGENPNMKILGILENELLPYESKIVQDLRIDRQALLDYGFTRGRVDALVGSRGVEGHIGAGDMSRR